MKNNFLKYILILSLLMNVSLLAAAGYTHYQQSRSNLAAPLSCDHHTNYLFQELSLKPEQINCSSRRPRHSMLPLARKDRKWIN